MTQRIALVTGGNRGIGRAVCEALAAQNIAVVVAARNESAARAVAASLPDGRAIQLDITDTASVRAARDRIGHVDILVNNAGILLDEGTDALTLDLETIRQTLDTNLLGAWRMCQAFVPGMRQHRWGRIVNVSSGAGSIGGGLWQDAPAYSVSKAALNALTVLLAQRLRGTGVLVNACDPGWVRTDMGGRGASRRPAEAARGIVWLATLPEDGPTGGFFHERQREPW